MKQEIFKELYDKFDDQFQIADYQKNLTYWKNYVDGLGDIEEFPIDKWIKQNENDKTYLPSYLEHQEKLFGHARPGLSSNGYMIYKHSKGGFYDGYQKKDKFFDDISKIENDYNSNISKLIMKLIHAASLEEIYEIEKSYEYIKFSGKQLLRKISVLMSMLETSNYKYELTWIYRDESLYSIAEILDVDTNECETVLQLNNHIYSRAKIWAEIGESSDLLAHIKLTEFLWFLTDTSYNVKELSDINANNIIFHGAPGTGKTYSVSNGIEKLQSINSTLYKDAIFTQFHPSYTYQDFIEGIKPVGIVGGNLDLKVINGTFKDFCIRVKKENEKYYSEHYEEHKTNAEKNITYKNWPQYFYVVDEINRGNLSNIFGETFTLLENRDYDFSGEYTKPSSNLVSTALSRVIETVDNNDELIYKNINDRAFFGIPFNIHFIGIMNDVDRSIEPFDLALRRRFKWVPMFCNYEIIEDLLIENGFNEETVSDYIESCKKLNDYICNKGMGLGRSYEIGHAFFLKILNVSNQKRITKTAKNIVFENFILGTLQEYIRQVADESEVDDYVKKAQDEFGI